MILHGYVRSITKGETALDDEFYEVVFRVYDYDPQVQRKSFKNIQTLLRVGQATVSIRQVR